MRDARLKAKISQEELAHRAGLHRTYVSLLERGERNPSLNVIIDLARALGTTGAALLGKVEARRDRG
ncbi:MAG: helix-turn-helix transcriptional regulator [Myxococcota bacterium]